METVLRAPVRSRLKECLVSVGTQVETGATLLRLEPLADDDDDDDDAATDTTDAVELELPAEPTHVEPHERTTRTQEDLRSQLLGYDVDPQHRTRPLDDYLTVRHAALESGRRPLADELELITVFADLAELNEDSISTMRCNGSSRWPSGWSMRAMVRSVSADPTATCAPSSTPASPPRSGRRWVTCRSGAACSGC